MKQCRLLTIIFSLTLILNAGSLNAAPVLWVGDIFGTLGTVDVATGDVTIIGKMEKTMTDIAFDPSGNLYGIDGVRLYSIDKTIAAITLIGGPVFANSLVFGSDGTLYTATSSLLTVDPTTGSSTLIGSGGDPYNSSGDLAFIGGELYLSSVASLSDEFLRLI